MRISSKNKLKANHNEEPGTAEASPIDANIFKEQIESKSQRIQDAGHGQLSWGTSKKPAREIYLTRCGQVYKKN